MDVIDRKIVGLLQTHGRMDHEQIARAVNLSRPAVHGRVRRMEASGALKGYGAAIDWAALGKPMTAFIAIRAGGRCNETGYAILALGDEGASIEECHRIIGKWGMLEGARRHRARAAGSRRSDPRVARCPRDDDHDRPLRAP